MFRPRIIPVLLLKHKGLVKSVRFRNHRYIGDPINAVRLFNDLKADELVFLDITATREGRLIPLDFVTKVGEEANMPFAVGGGIRNLDDIRRIIAAGAEKVIINNEAGRKPGFINDASKAFGSSTIVVCMDVRKDLFGRKKVYFSNGTSAPAASPVEYAKMMEEMGAGEIIVQSVDNDGTMEGYDVEQVRQISEEVQIPVVALGGAGKMTHLKKCYDEGYASALAAGSMFIYQGSRRGILINYPDREEISRITA